MAGLPLHLYRYKEDGDAALDCWQLPVRNTGRSSLPTALLPAVSWSIREPSKTLDRVRESWQSTFGGSGNANKVAVLEEGMKYTPIGISPEQAQFLETRKFQINEIARIFRVPPHMVGDLETGLLSPPQKHPAITASTRDGRVGLYVEEKNRSWCSSSNANDQRAITIECASDTSEPYAFRDVVYQKLIVLCVDICKRNGKKKLLWFGDKEKTLNYSPKADEMVLTVHRWFANKSCPGNWLYARMGDLADKVTAQLEDGSDSGGGTAAKGTQASALRNLSEADAIKKVGALFTADQKKTGILASVSLAQFILESGYGKSELAQNANNVFGMKCSLSGNTWTGSTWTGRANTPSRRRSRMRMAVM